MRSVGQYFDLSSAFCMYSCCLSCIILTSNYIMTKHSHHFTSFT